jgi:hypothetical protein
MGKTKKCKECGVKIVEHKHYLNLSLVKSLQIIFEKSEDQPIKISLLPLTLVQVCNFQKLKYWKLVKSLGGGEWKLTHKGGLFLNGTISIHRSVCTFRGTVTKYEGDEVNIYDIDPTFDTGGAL